MSSAEYALNGRQEASSEFSEKRSCRVASDLHLNLGQCDVVHLNKHDTSARNTPLLLNLQGGEARRYHGQHLYS